MIELGTQTPEGLELMRWVVEHGHIALLLVLVFVLVWDEERDDV